MVDLLDPSAPTVGIAGRNRPLLRRMAAMLRRRDLDIAAVATDLRELMLECADMQIQAAVCATRDLGELEPHTRMLRRRMPGTQLVVVMPDPRGPTVKKALDLGVAGIVPESEIGFALAPTVEAVCAGQIVVPHEAVGQLGYPLTKRQRAVLELVQEGLTNHEIGSRLYLAESTVKSHVSVAFSKLGVHSRKEAKAVKIDDFDPPEPRRRR